MMTTGSRTINRINFQTERLEYVKPTLSIPIKYKYLFATIWPNNSEQIYAIKNDTLIRCNVINEYKPIIYLLDKPKAFNVPKLLLFEFK